MLLKKFFVLLIMVLSIVGLEACGGEFAFGNTNRSDFVLNTNDISLEGTVIFGGVNITGSYDLFTISNKNGFVMNATVSDNFLFGKETFFTINGLFIDSLSKRTNEVKEQADALEIFYDELCDIYIDNNKISQKSIITVVKYDANLFENDLIFKNNAGQEYILKLTDKQKDIINKKLSIYEHKKQLLLDELGNLRGKKAAGTIRYVNNSFVLD